MSRIDALPHEGHEGRDDIAYHIPWDFREQAVVSGGTGKIPKAPNFHPIATEFHNWLVRRGEFAVFTKSERDFEASYSNPHTFSGSVIAAILAESINDSHEFSHSTKPIEPLSAEIGRVRLYNEQVINTARLLEALIKQLLYCTQIGRKYYKKTALGGLLATDCRACKAKRHKISLLGSLAHRYGLCRPFEECAMNHIRVVNRQRNIEAAHSDTQELDVTSGQVSRDRLAKDCIGSGEDLVHMLTHLGQLEAKMDSEIKRRFGLILTRPIPPLELVYPPEEEESGSS